MLDPGFLSHISWAALKEPPACWDFPAALLKWFSCKKDLIQLPWQQKKQPETTREEGALDLKLLLDEPAWTLVPMGMVLSSGSCDPSSAAFKFRVSLSRS